MKKSKKNQKNEDLRDLKYVLNVNRKGYLWWKKPIYKTHIADIIAINDDPKPATIEPIYKGDNRLKEEFLNYIDNKLESLNVFSKDIIPDVYTMCINSNWKNEEFDKAVNYFVSNIIRYKSVGDKLSPTENV